jgi:hypothetical protein
MAAGKNDWSITEKWPRATSWGGNLNGFEGFFRFPAQPATGVTAEYFSRSIQEGMTNQHTS